MNSLTMNVKVSLPNGTVLETQISGANPGDVLFKAENMFPRSYIELGKPVSWK